MKGKNIVYPEVQILPDIESVHYEIDPIDQFKQYYSGLWQNQITMSDGTVRTYKVYCPANSRRDDDPLFIAVPDGAEVSSFLAESGWIKIADDEKNPIILCIFEPEGKFWGTLENELEYFTKVFQDFASYDYFYFGDFHWRWVGYGAGGSIMHHYIMMHPLSTAAFVSIDGSSGFTSSWLEHNSATHFSVVSDRGSEAIGVETDYMFDKTFGEIPVPVWIISKELDESTNNVIDYWKKANSCLPEPIFLADNTKIYREHPFSSSPITYLQKIGQVKVSQKEVLYTDPELSLAAYKFVHSFARTGIVSPYGNILKETIPDESIFKRFTKVIDGINREWFVYVPTNYSKSGTPFPLVLYNHGNGQSGLVAMRQNDWWQIGEEKGFITVCASASLVHFKHPFSDKPSREQIPRMSWNTSKSWVSKTDDVHFFRVLIELLKEEYNIDSSRIYITGQSNGCGMTNRMVWEAPELFAAMATTGGVMILDENGLPDYNNINAEKFDVPVFYNIGHFESHNSRIISLEKVMTFHMNQFKTCEENAYFYQNGQHNNKIWLNEDGVPILRLTEAMLRAHSHRPDENRIFWDEWFALFKRDSNGKICYMGK